MRSGFFLVLGLIFLAYGGINYYIGLRGWQYLGRFIPHLPKGFYWATFWFVSLAYILGRVIRRFSPAASDLLTVVGAYWMAAMYYLIFILLIIDLIKLLNGIWSFLPNALSGQTGNFYWGLTAVVLIISIVTYGIWNARHPRIQPYELTIPKQAGNMQQLHVVAVSDIHLGNIVDNARLKELVQSINSLNPEVVLLVGDTIDESVETFVEQKMADTFKLLKAKYGVYAAFGNHEYISGHAEEAAQYLEEAGVTVLRDRFVKVNESFYVVGRDDSSRHRLGAQPRKDLKTLLEGVDKSLPMILLDHQPSRLNEAASQGIDLQLSGHTHRGQLFPNHLITQRIYELDWGYLKKGATQFIVSSGYGTWGPPIRIGNHPEILDLKITFPSMVDPG